MLKNKRNLWISYFKDADFTLNQVKTIINSNDSANLYLNVNSLNDYSNSLSKKLKDFQAIFEYYVESTQEFSKGPRTQLFLYYQFIYLNI